MDDKQLDYLLKAVQITSKDPTQQSSMRGRGKGRGFGAQYNSNSNQGSGYRSYNRGYNKGYYNSNPYNTYGWNNTDNSGDNNTSE